MTQKNAQTSLTNNAPYHQEKRQTEKLRTIGKLEMEGRMFNCNTVKEAVRDGKSKALRPDRIASIHLQHLGPIALRYLTDTIKRSANCTLLKPGLAIEESKRFRAIELFRQLQNRKTRKLTKTLTVLIDFTECTLKDYQDGFRPEHSTTTASNVVSKDNQKEIVLSPPLSTRLITTYYYKP